MVRRLSLPVIKISFKFQKASGFLLLWFLFSKGGTVNYFFFKKIELLESKIQI